MEVESLIELVGSGNIATVDEQWLGLYEAPDLNPSSLVKYKDVLASLVEKKRQDQAQAMAWTAIESLSSQFSSMETLTVAGPFLLAVGEGEELRNMVSDLYRSAYPDQPGLEELLTEAGLPKGRPVRRALRTLEVCLNIKEGDYLSSRDEDEAVRVESIDIPAWEYSILTSGGLESLGAVRLADQYQAAGATDIRVLKQFDKDQLLKRLQKDPTSIVIEICQLNECKTDSDQIQSMLVPDIIPDADWKKWWTRARTALKKCTNIKIEGRSPYFITYIDEAIGFDVRMMAEFTKHRDPVSRFEIVDQYVRGCKTRNEAPSDSAIRSCIDYFVSLAKKRENNGSSQAVLIWCMARYLGDVTGLEEGTQGIVECLRNPKTKPNWINEFTSKSMLQLACESLIEAKPQEWQELFLEWIPDLPAGICNWATSKLIESGKTRSDIEPLVQQILSSPVSHFEALLWLWDGPSEKSLQSMAAPLNILTRILRALDQCRINEKIPKDTVRNIYARVRSVMAARKYERFLLCINEIDEGMAKTLRSQIYRLDGLGIAVKEDMINHLLDIYPDVDTSLKRIPKWAEEDTLYVTQQGMTRRQEEIDHHVNVKIRENAIAIGDAAEKGDLSENSEYKFALEERDLLRARLLQMNDEMASAQIISPEEVITDMVNIATKAVFIRETDQERYEVTFLGPWEADVDHACFNYKAPLAQKLMGKKVGDVVEFDHTGAKGTYKLTEILNALAV